MKKVKAMPATRVFRLHEHEAQTDRVRLNPNLMGEGGFSRNDLISIKNKANGKKTFAYAAGAGEDYKLFPTTIALSYDARLRLDVTTKDTHELELKKATFIERELFYLFHQRDHSARRAQQYSVQGWMLGVLGLGLGIISLIPS